MFTAAVLTFFIAGLLYLLRFERVDNLGAYTASRLETGLLIPSVYITLKNHDTPDHFVAKQTTQSPRVCL
jgi:hypothetical protein